MARFGTTTQLITNLKKLDPLSTQPGISGLSRFQSSRTWRRVTLMGWKLTFWSPRRVLVD
jgi:hypothetical protein